MGIKVYVFIIFAGEVNKSPTKPTPSLRNREMGRIMWAKTKCGQMVQIKLDYDRPAQFKVSQSCKFF